MEQGLRDCCRSIRIGKILVESDADTHEARVVYARFPDDVSRRHVSDFHHVLAEFNSQYYPGFANVSHHVDRQHSKQGRERAERAWG